VSSEAITLSATAGFNVIDPESGTSVFTSDFNNEGARFPDDVRYLNAQKIQTNRVRNFLRIIYFYLYT
jgi:hypothetical protein